MKKFFLRKYELQKEESKRKSVAVDYSSENGKAEPSNYNSQNRGFSFSFIKEEMTKKAKLSR